MKVTYELPEDLSTLLGNMSVGDLQSFITDCIHEHFNRQEDDKRREVQIDVMLSLLTRLVESSNNNALTMFSMLQSIQDKQNISPTLTQEQLQALQLQQTPQVSEPELEPEPETETLTGEGDDDIDFDGLDDFIGFVSM